MHQGGAVVDKLLVALWHAEFQCRYGLYRTGLIMLADISMEFGLSQKARKMVEDIMPQVVSRSHDQNLLTKSLPGYSRWGSRAKGVCVFYSCTVHHDVRT